jgi:hypothetical protein
MFVPGSFGQCWRRIFSAHAGIFAMVHLFIFDDPNYWRNRAEEMRILAASVTSPETRVILLRVATDYDLLAERAEEAKLGNLPD